MYQTPHLFLHILAWLLILASVKDNEGNAMLLSSPAINDLRPRRASRHNLMSSMTNPFIGPSSPRSSSSTPFSGVIGYQGASGPGLHGNVGRGIMDQSSRPGAEPTSFNSFPAYPSYGRERTPPSLTFNRMPSSFGQRNPIGPPSRNDSPFRNLFGSDIGNSAGIYDSFGKPRNEKPFQSARDNPFMEKSDYRPHRNHPFSSLRLNPITKVPGVDVAGPNRRHSSLKPSQSFPDRGYDVDANSGSPMFSDNRAQSFDQEDPFEKPISRSAFPLPHVNDPITLDLAKEERERINFAKKTKRLPPPRKFINEPDEKQVGGGAESTTDGIGDQNDNPNNQLLQSSSEINPSRAVGNSLSAVFNPLATGGFKANSVNGKKLTLPSIPSSKHDHEKTTSRQEQEEDGVSPFNSRLQQTNKAVDTDNVKTDNPSSLNTRTTPQTQDIYDTADEDESNLVPSEASNSNKNPPSQTEHRESNGKDNNNDGPQFINDGNNEPQISDLDANYQEKNTAPYSTNNEHELNSYNTAPHSSNNEHEPSSYNTAPHSSNNEPVYDNYYDYDYGGDMFRDPFQQSPQSIKTPKERTPGKYDRTTVTEEQIQKQSGSMPTSNDLDPQNKAIGVNNKDNSGDSVPIPESIHATKRIKEETIESGKRTVTNNETLLPVDHIGYILTDDMYDDNGDDNAPSMNYNTNHAMDNSNKNENAITNINDNMNSGFSPRNSFANSKGINAHPNPINKQNGDLFVGDFADSLFQPSPVTANNNILSPSGLLEFDGDEPDSSSNSPSQGKLQPARPPAVGSSYLNPDNSESTGSQPETQHNLQSKKDAIDTASTSDNDNDKFNGNNQDYYDFDYNGPSTNLEDRPSVPNVEPSNRNNQREKTNMKTDQGSIHKPKNRISSDSFFSNVYDDDDDGVGGGGGDFLGPNFNLLEAGEGSVRVRKKSNTFEPGHKEVNDVELSGTPMTTQHDESDRTDSESVSTSSSMPAKSSKPSNAASVSKPKDSRTSQERLDKVPASSGLATGGITGGPGQKYKPESPSIIDGDTSRANEPEEEKDEYADLFRPPSSYETIEFPKPASDAFSSSSAFDYPTDTSSSSLPSIASPSSLGSPFQSMFGKTIDQAEKGSFGSLFGRFLHPDKEVISQGQNQGHAFRDRVNPSIGGGTVNHNGEGYRSSASSGHGGGVVVGGSGGLLDKKLGKIIETRPSLDLFGRKW